MKGIAQIISWVFLPLFMPVIGLLLTLYVPSEQDFYLNSDCLYALPVEFKSILLWVFLIFCVLFPAISFLIMKQSGILQSIEMETQKERDYPILIMLAYCLFLYFVLYTKLSEAMVPRFVFALPLSGVFVTVVFFFLNRWKKLSIHAAAAGILTGYTLAYILSMTDYQLWILMVSLLISGIVMSARLYLQKHDLLEVVLGWLVGGIITFVINYMY